MKKRRQRFADLLEELEGLSLEEQHVRLMNLGKPVDAEQESDDYEEDEQESLAIESTAAERMDQLRNELYELERLVKLADQTIKAGTEAKLNQLK